MTFKALQNLITNTTAYTAVGADQIVLPASVIAMLIAQLDGGYYTAVSVTDGVNYEVMNIIGVTAGAADVERGQDGTVAVPLAKGSQVRFVWTTAGITDVAPAGAVTLTGSGGSTVTGGPNYNVSSPIWTFTAGPGIGITGGPYAFTISNTNISSPVTVTGSGIAVASGGPVNYNIDVSAPNFVGAGGITVSGVWPNITITNTASPGTGTLVGVTAGAGIAVTGPLTTNPIVSLATVGPGVGTYGGIQLNAYGQVVAIAGGTILSVSTTTSGVTIGGPTGGALTINVANAAVGQRGLVALAPATDAGSNDSGNTTEAVTPAGIAAVTAAFALVNTPASLTVTGNQNSVTPSLYVNLIPTFSIAIPAVPTGKSVLVDLYVESYDPSNPTVVQAFGVGLFDGVGLIAGNSSIVPSNVRVLKCLIAGPYAAQTLSVKTTAMGATQVIGSFYASVVRNY
jgi:hypothetical protein